MSFKEIKELRKAGNLDQALQIAEKALETERENIWNKRAAAWVYYDFIKLFSKPEHYDSFKENLIKIKNLQLPDDERMIFDNCAWQIGSVVFALQKDEKVDFVKINEIFSIIQDYHFTKPSKEYSFIYKAFHKGYHNWQKYLDFADWWNFENFSSDDFINEEYNGKKMMSIVEQAYIAYSKKLLEGNSQIWLDVQVNGVITQMLNREAYNNKMIDRKKILSFLPLLDNIIEKHPDYQYPPYFKAKLLLAIGSEDNVLSAFLPFAKQKRNDFWVWELMAEIFSDVKEIQFSCYCKALSLKSPDDFVVKLRQKFAEALVNRQMYNEAKTEIEKIIKTRSKNEWKLSNQITQWTEKDWYKSARTHNDNRELYSKYVKKAEELLFQDIPEEVIAVEFVNENKHLLTFVKDKHKHGFFNYSGNLDNPQIGDVLKVRFNGDGQDGFYKILSAKKEGINEHTDAIKRFESQLRLISSQNIGFVQDVLIDSRLVQLKKLVDGQVLKGKAILSYNKKKSEWGWKAIEVE